MMSEEEKGNAHVLLNLRERNETSYGQVPDIIGEGRGLMSLACKAGNKNYVQYLPIAGFIPPS